MEMVKLLLFLLLLFVLNCQLTMGEGNVTTSGPLSKICTENNLGDNQSKPLANADEYTITRLLGCSQSLAMISSSTHCEIGYSDTVTCDCTLDTNFCRVTEIHFAYRNLEGELPETIGNLTNLTSLVLYGNDFHGEIPTSYANLKNLKRLDLEGNTLEGSIPSFLGDMKLEALDLSGNSFAGSIPTQLGSLVNLTVLDLSHNSLNGSIPPQLGSLVNLTSLDLSDNLIGGSIPTQLGSLVNLTYLDLSKNFFNDSIPTELGSLVNLTDLILGTNLLSGGIPSEIGKLKRLETLDLSDNKISGPLPEDPDQLGDLALLEYLHLENNELVGGLPAWIKRLNSLRYFNVRGNNLNGTIPDSIGQLLNLTYLSLMGNSFEGPLTREISKLINLKELYLSDLVGARSEFPDFTNMVSLEYLTMRKCLLVGNIPDIIWNLTDLYHLDLSFNRLIGGIPTHISNRLSYIFLRGNNLKGKIPKWIMNSTARIDVSENFFTNNVEEIQKLNSNSSNRNFFSSCYNFSDTTVTDWEQVGYSCNDTEQLLDHSLYINCGGESMAINGSNYESDLNSNGSSTFFLSSSLKWGYSSMGYSSSNDRYIMNNTCVVGVGDEPLYSTARVSPISLKYYGFCLRNDDYNVKLHFTELLSSDNKTPYINRSRRVFDVDIQGENVLKDFNIEKEAGGVNKAYTVEVENIKVNNSRLEIHLYWSGKGSLEGPTEFHGPLVSAISVYPSKPECNGNLKPSNPTIVDVSIVLPVDLQGRIPKEELYVPQGTIYPICQDSVTADQTLSFTREKGMSAPKMAAISLSVLLVLVVLMVYFWKMEDSSDEGLVELYPGGLYNFKRIKVAANNFKNKLGEGGFGTFYEARLGNGTAVAVEKVSATKDIIRAFREKDSTISLMEHPNLVKLMGCIAEKNQLLLVYEDIGHNSLQNALFGPNRLSLEWATRRNICLGIAEGLAFLHECKQKNVHGNIKPTSIFLDKHLNAKIADFGFSRLHDQGKSREEGTVVYMAPEYAKYDLLTTKADVYSFGVVVLIVVSGKEGKISNSSSQDETEYLPDLAVREKQRKGHFMNLLEKSISETVDDWNEADTMLELALMCLEQYPDQRPTMSQAVKVLKNPLELDDLKDKIKQLTSGKDTDISTAEDTTRHSKSRSTSRGGMTDASVSVSASPSTGSTV